MEVSSFERMTKLLRLKKCIFYLCLIILSTSFHSVKAVKIGVMHYGNYARHGITCNRDELILISSEVLGYSRDSECNPRPMCSVPYTLAKWYCRGKSSCSGIPVERRPLHKRTCGSDFTNCLRVEYHCVKRSNLLDVCQDRQIQQSSHGFLVSPSFPDMYPPDQNCTCHLQSNSHNPLQLKKIFFILKASKPCHDWLGVQTDGVHRESRCGYNPQDGMYRGNKIELNFRSDAQNQEMGFWLEYRSADSQGITIKCGSPFKPTNNIFRRKGMTTMLDLIKWQNRKDNSNIAKEGVDKDTGKKKFLRTGRTDNRLGNRNKWRSIDTSNNLLKEIKPKIKLRQRLKNNFKNDYEKSMKVSKLSFHDKSYDHPRFQKTEIESFQGRPEIPDKTYEGQKGLEPIIIQDNYLVLSPTKTILEYETNTPETLGKLIYTPIRHQNIQNSSLHEKQLKEHEEKNKYPNNNNAQQSKAAIKQRVNQIRNMKKMKDKSIKAFQKQLSILNNELQKVLKEEQFNAVEAESNSIPHKEILPLIDSKKNLDNIFSNFPISKDQKPILPLKNISEEHDYKNMLGIKNKETRIETEIPYIEKFNNNIVATQTAVPKTTISPFTTKSPESNISLTSLNVVSNNENHNLTKNGDKTDNSIMNHEENNLENVAHPTEPIITPDIDTTTKPTTFIATTTIARIKLPFLNIINTSPAITINPSTTQVYTTTNKKDNITKEVIVQNTTITDNTTTFIESNEGSTQDFTFNTISVSELNMEVIPHENPKSNYAGNMNDKFKEHKYSSDSKDVDMRMLPDDTEGGEIYDNTIYKTNDDKNTQNLEVDPSKDDSKDVDMRMLPDDTEGGEIYDNTIYITNDDKNTPNLEVKSDLHLIPGNEPQTNDNNIIQVKNTYSNDKHIQNKRFDIGAYVTNIMEEEYTSTSNSNTMPPAIADTKSKHALYATPYMTQAFMSEELMKVINQQKPGAKTNNDNHNTEHVIQQTENKIDDEVQHHILDDPPTTNESSKQQHEYMSHIAPETKQILDDNNYDMKDIKHDLVDLRKPFDVEKEVIYQNDLKTAGRKIKVQHNPSSSIHSHMHKYSKIQKEVPDYIDKHILQSNVIQLLTPFVYENLHSNMKNNYNNKKPENIFLPSNKINPQYMNQQSISIKHDEKSYTTPTSQSIYNTSMSSKPYLTSTFEHISNAYNKYDNSAIYNENLNQIQHSVDSVNTDSNNGTSIKNNDAKILSPNVENGKFFENLLEEKDIKPSPVTRSSYKALDNNLPEQNVSITDEYHTANIRENEFPSRSNNDKMVSRVQTTENAPSNSEYQPVTKLVQQLKSKYGSPEYFYKSLTEHATDTDKLKMVEAIVLDFARNSEFIKVLESMKTSMKTSHTGITGKYSTTEITPTKGLTTLNDIQNDFISAEVNNPQEQLKLTTTDMTIVKDKINVSSIDTSTYNLSVGIDTSYLLGSENYDNMSDNQNNLLSEKMEVFGNMYDNQNNISFEKMELFAKNHIAENASESLSSSKHMKNNSEYDSKLSIEVFPYNYSTNEVTTDYHDLKDEEEMKRLLKAMADVNKIKEESNNETLIQDVMTDQKLTLSDHSVLNNHTIGNEQENTTAVDVQYFEDDMKNIAETLTNNVVTDTNSSTESKDAPQNISDGSNIALTEIDYSVKDYLLSQTDEKSLPPSNDHVDTDGSDIINTNNEYNPEHWWNQYWQDKWQEKWKKYKKKHPENIETNLLSKNETTTSDWSQNPHNGWEPSPDEFLKPDFDYRKPIIPPYLGDDDPDTLPPGISRDEQFAKWNNVYGKWFSLGEEKNPIEDFVEVIKKKWEEKQQSRHKDNGNYLNVDYQYQGQSFPEGKPASKDDMDYLLSQGPLYTDNQNYKWADERGQGYNQKIQKELSYQHKEQSGSLITEKSNSEPEPNRNEEDVHEGSLYLQIEDNYEEGNNLHQETAKNASVDRYINTSHEDLYTEDEQNLGIYDGPLYLDGQVEKQTSDERDNNMNTQTRNEIKPWDIKSNELYLEDSNKNDIGDVDTYTGQFIDNKEHDYYIDRNTEDKLSTPNSGAKILDRPLQFAGDIEVGMVDSIGEHIISRMPLFDTDIQEIDYSPMQSNFWPGVDINNEPGSEHLNLHNAADIYDNKPHSGQLSNKRLTTPWDIRARDNKLIEPVLNIFPTHAPPDVMENRVPHDILHETNYDTPTKIWKPQRVWDNNNIEDTHENHNNRISTWNHPQNNPNSLEKNGPLTPWDTRLRVQEGMHDDNIHYNDIDRQDGNLYQHIHETMPLSYLKQNDDFHNIDNNVDDFNKIPVFNQRPQIEHSESVNPSHGGNNIERFQPSLENDPIYEENNWDRTNEFPIFHQNNIVNLETKPWEEKLQHEPGHLWQEHNPYKDETIRNEQNNVLYHNRQENLENNFQLNEKTKIHNQFPDVKPKRRQKSTITSRPIGKELQAKNEQIESPWLTNTLDTYDVQAVPDKYPIIDRPDHRSRKDDFEIEPSENILQGHDTYEVQAGLYKYPIIDRPDHSSRKADFEIQPRENQLQGHDTYDVPIAPEKYPIIDRPDHRSRKVDFEIGPSENILQGHDTYVVPVGREKYPIIDRPDHSSRKADFEIQPRENQLQGHDTYNVPVGPEKYPIIDRPDHRSRKVYFEIGPSENILQGHDTYVVPVGREKYPIIDRPDHRSRKVDFEIGPSENILQGHDTYVVPVGGEKYPIIDRPDHRSQKADFEIESSENQLQGHDTYDVQAVLEKYPIIERPDHRSQKADFEIEPSENQLRGHFIPPKLTTEVNTKSRKRTEKNNFKQQKFQRMKNEADEIRFDIDVNIVNNEIKEDHKTHPIGDLPARTRQSSNLAIFNKAKQNRILKDRQYKQPFLDENPKSWPYKKLPPNYSTQIKPKSNWISRPTPRWQQDSIHTTSPHVTGRIRQIDSGNVALADDGSLNTIVEGNFLQNKHENTRPKVAKDRYLQNRFNNQRLASFRKKSNRNTSFQDENHYNINKFGKNSQFRKNSKNDFLQERRNSIKYPNKENIKNHLPPAKISNHISEVEKETDYPYGVLPTHMKHNLGNVDPTLYNRIQTYLGQKNTLAPGSKMAAVGAKKTESTKGVNKNTVWILLVVAIFGWLIFMAMVGLLIYYKRERMCHRKMMQRHGYSSSYASTMPKHLLFPDLHSPLCSHSHPLNSSSDQSPSIPTRPQSTNSTDSLLGIATARAAATKPDNPRSKRKIKKYQQKSMIESQLHNLGLRDNETSSNHSAFSSEPMSERPLPDVPLSYSSPIVGVHRPPNRTRSSSMCAEMAFSSNSSSESIGLQEVLMTNDDSAELDIRSIYSGGTFKSNKSHYQSLNTIRDRKAKNKTLDTRSFSNIKQLEKHFTKFDKYNRPVDNISPENVRSWVQQNMLSNGMNGSGQPPYIISNEQNYPNNAIISDEQNMGTHGYMNHHLSESSFPNPNQPFEQMAVIKPASPTMFKQYLASKTKLSSFMPLDEPPFCQNESDVTNANKTNKGNLPTSESTTGNHMEGISAFTPQISPTSSTNSSNHPISSIPHQYPQSSTPFNTRRPSPANSVVNQPQSTHSPQKKLQSPTKPIRHNESRPNNSTDTLESNNSNESMDAIYMSLTKIATKYNDDIPPTNDDNKTNQSPSKPPQPSQPDDFPILPPPTFTTSFLPSSSNSDNSLIDQIQHEQQADNYYQNSRQITIELRNQERKDQKEIDDILTTQESVSKDMNRAEMSVFTVSELYNQQNYNTSSEEEITTGDGNEHQVPNSNSSLPRTIRSPSNDQVYLKTAPNMIIDKMTNTSEAISVGSQDNSSNTGSIMASSYAASVASDSSMTNITENSGGSSRNMMQPSGHFKQYIDISNAYTANNNNTNPNNVSNSNIARVKNTLKSQIITVPPSSVSGPSSSYLNAHLERESNTQVQSSNKPPLGISGIHHTRGGGGITRGTELTKSQITANAKKIITTLSQTKPGSSSERIKRIIPEQATLFNEKVKPELNRILMQRTRRLPVEV